MNIEHLIGEWKRAKEAETDAAADRRETEDALCKALHVPADADGTSSHKVAPSLTVRITSRINRKVNSDLLQELAAAHGLSDQLPALFRWKPEVNKRSWDAAHEDITRPLSAAITAKPGRPSFTVIEETD